MSELSISGSGTQPQPGGAFQAVLPQLSPAFVESMDRWAERIVVRGKEGMRAGTARWVWGLPFWYRHGGDAWCDDAWWFETAEMALGVDPQDPRAFEVLLGLEPERYREAARAAVDVWASSGGVDTPRWTPVLGHFYPVHAAARELFEQGTGYETVAAAALAYRAGYTRARDMLRRAFLDYRQDKELVVLADALVPVGADLISKVLSGPELEWVRADCVDICSQSPNQSGAFADQGAALRWAITMGWDEIPAALSSNGDYPSSVLFGPPGRARVSLRQGNAEARTGVGLPPRDAVVAALRRHVVGAVRGSGSIADAGPPCQLDWSWQDTELLLWSLTPPGPFSAQLIAASAALSKLCSGVDFHYRLMIAIAWMRARAAERA